MPLSPTTDSRFNDDDWYIWNADTKLIVRIVGCRSLEVQHGRLPDIEPGQAMARGMKARFQGLRFGDEGKSIWDMTGELGGLVAEAKTLGGPAAMTARQYASAAGNKLPKGFAEEERRRMWRRKGDDELASVTAQRDALAKVVRTSIGNVRSLGPAGDLDGLLPHTNYRVWLAALETAFDAAEVAV